MGHDTAICLWSFYHKMVSWTSNFPVHFREGNDLFEFRIVWRQFCILRRTCKWRTWSICFLCKSVNWNINESIF